MQETYKILLVEDQLLIAMDAEILLNEHGFHDILTATNLTDARKAAESSRVSIAILDINVGDETSYSFAQELDANNIPIAFTSGYHFEDAKKFGLEHIPVIAKPFGEAQLVQTVSLLLEAANKQRNNAL